MKEIRWLSEFSSLSEYTRLYPIYFLLMLFCIKLLKINFTT